ncbi:MAG TPA: GNAT family N-acetyltransferase [Puia sp.]|jgi:ribosomal protein S18 acetylase RimI-like enzyme|nr:GNAT family N-acetyltransferase [Puia sp.]
MKLLIRPAKPEDAQTCAVICYNAFKAIAEAHHFPPDFPHTEMAVGLMNYAFSGAGIYSVVAEENGQIVGSNILWENGLIGGVGPITVDTACQNADVGRKLMEQVLLRAEEIKLAGVRLVQAAYHNRSLALYTKLGFDVREPLSVIQGAAPGIRFPGYDVRVGNESDLKSCNELCYQIHGHERGSELSGAIRTGTFFVVEFDGKISGYTTQVGFLGHTIAATNTGLKALIGASANFSGPGFLLPSRNAEVLRWCLQNGLRIVEPMTLMSKGLYNEPAGAFLPSVLY